MNVVFCEGAAEAEEADDDDDGVCEGVEEPGSWRPLNLRFARRSDCCCFTASCEGVERCEEDDDAAPGFKEDEEESEDVLPGAGEFITLFAKTIRACSRWEVLSMVLFVATVRFQIFTSHVGC